MSRMCAFALLLRCARAAAAVRCSAGARAGARAGALSHSHSRALGGAPSAHVSAASAASTPLARLRALRAGSELLAGRFRVVACAEVPELNVPLALLLHHTRLGCAHLHVVAPEAALPVADAATTTTTPSDAGSPSGGRCAADNAFAVAFRTVPSDSRGAAHVLEHTALCGSERFPVRDPFFNMLRRSTATFMNAFTGSDYTLYPFSTQNATDFYNLLAVYLDATFFSTLNELDFRQEGHRLEFAVGPDGAKTLAFKGIVFNEMKGALADPGSFFGEKLSETLFPPDSPYHMCSGGNPADIPSLSHGDLVRFKERHYHPSNALFYTYGDLPLERHLEFIEDRVLSRFEPDTAVRVPPTRRFSEPKHAHMLGPPNPMGAGPDRSTKAAVSYLCNPVVDTFETFSLSFLSALLLSGPNAPLHKALIEPNLGSGYAPGTGFDDSARECTFTVGLSDCSEENARAVEGIVEATLRDVAANGIERARIDALFHQIEFSRKHVGESFGLSLLYGLLSSWLHGGDPIAELSLEALLARLRAELDAGPYFQTLVRRHLLDNPHRVVVSVSPNEAFVAEHAAREEAQLRAVRERLGPADEAAIAAQTEALRVRQSMVEDRSCLPRLSVERDIPRTVKRTVLAETRAGTTPLFVSEQPTNGLVYVRGVVGLEDLAAPLRAGAGGATTAELALVPLLLGTAPLMDTARRTHGKLAQALEECTGSLSLYPTLTHSLSNPDDFSVGLGFEVSALERNAPRALALLREILADAVYSNGALLRTHLAGTAMGLEHLLMSSGHSFALTSASASLGPKFLLDDVWSGLRHLHFVQRIVRTDPFVDGASPVLGALGALRDAVFRRRLDRVLLTCEPCFRAEGERLVGAFVAEQDACAEGFDVASAAAAAAAAAASAAGEGAAPPLAVPRVPLGGPQQRLFVAVPGEVNNAAMVSRGCAFLDADATALKLATCVASQRFLHNIVREKGGAYGSGVRAENGTLEFFSYRDPNIEATLDAFIAAGTWLKKGEFDDEAIEEAKLAIFGDLDAPVVPSARGLLFFTLGITNALRDKRREEFFALTKEDVVRVAHRYFDEARDVRVCVVGSEENRRLRNCDGWVWVQQNVG